jgi:cytochrome c553
MKSTKSMNSMKNWARVVVIAAVFVAAVDASPQQQAGTEPPPPWAYGFATVAGSTPQGPGAAAAPAAGAPAAEDTSLKHLPGSTLAFTLAQIRDGFGPADWYPQDHPQMPEIVAHGRKPEVRACSLCHYPNGKGRPENAPVAGLPYTYFVQTMADFKNGARKSADARKANTNAMVGFATAMTDEEIKAAAQYFSAMKWTPWIKVVETDTVPKTRAAGGMFLALDGAEREPLGDRIIEVPVNTEGTEMLRDARSGFIAYAPVGSIKKGEALVTNGAGKTTACAICHGSDLQGLGPVPGIAGRSPSYLGRQLYDMQHGSRTGNWVALMKPVVANLGNQDIVAIVAYLASREVAPASTSSSSATDPLVATGKARYNGYKCYDCHGPNGEGTDDAPNLTGTHLDAAGIAKFLQKPSADAQAKGMPDVPASSPDLQPLVAYVLSLKTAAK